MYQKINIAIDGPAGCGKSTVAKLVARKLDILYLDTGSMYRAIAYILIKRGIDIKEDADLISTLNSIDMQIKYKHKESSVFIDGEDVSPYLREEYVAIGASAAARLPKVREFLVLMQKSIAKNHSVVMDGRDIGTCVMPDTKHKFFLTAGLEVRAMRRYLENKESSSLEEITKDIQIRDGRDSGRSICPLIQAEDACSIDTGSFTPEQVAAIILDKVK